MSRGVEARRVAYQLASGQLGAVSRNQILSRGITRSTFEHWASSGYLLKVLPAVYTLARPAADHEIMWMAAVLFAGKGAALAGTAALAALGAGTATGEIDVVRPAGPKRTAQSSLPHLETLVTARKASIERGVIIQRGPIPLLDPARLLIDAAGRVDSKVLRRQFIELGRTDHLTAACLARIESRSRDYRGRSRLVLLASKWDPTKGRIRSILEGEFKLMCAEHRLPAPLTNRLIGRYEVDVLWERERIVVELDGRRFHSDAFALESDSEKSRYLRSLGYRVLRFTWLDVTERPEWVADRIREALSVV